MEENNNKSPLTPLGPLDKVYMQQIRAEADALQYGNLTVSFKVRGGEIKEAHVTKKAVKLRPF